MLEVLTWIAVITLLIAVGVVSTLVFTAKGIHKLFTKTKSDGKNKSGRKKR